MMNVAKNTPPRHIGFVKMDSLEPGRALVGSTVASWRATQTTVSQDGSQPVSITLASGETVSATAYRGRA